MLGKMSAMSRLCRLGSATGFRPTFCQTFGASGIVHPGIGLTKELLDNVQLQIRRGADPWKTYFEDMLESEAASETPYIYLQNPEEVSFDSQKINGFFIKDSLTAYTQAILYYVTGNNIYRRNALQILRVWSMLEPENFSYFTDACIHVGIPMNRICMGAEIIRYSSYRVADGYQEQDLKWTHEEIQTFITHLVSPAIKTFLSSSDEFMNQHLYTVIGAMSGTLFMDDAVGYSRTVEWFTVNKNGKNPGFNGAVSRLFREIVTVDEIGMEEGTGRPLPEPVIQHVEMGRDQAHGCGDLTNAAIIARLMLGQNTKVDPAKGTVTKTDGGVGVYEFLDDRILKAADFFFKYMLGYENDWVPTPFSIRDGKIMDLYMDFSPNYRGRYNTINFWDLYVYYTSSRQEIDLEKQYPYFYEGFMKKVPSNYYTKGKKVINWDNADGGGDFWLFVPAEMANDSRLLASPQTDYRVELEDRGTLVKNAAAMSVKRESGIGYIRCLRSPEKSEIAVTTGGTDKSVIAFRIRTDGVARLSLRNGVKGSVWLPDTKGRWRYVFFARRESESFGDLYYLSLSDFLGNYVDIDAIDIKPDETNSVRENITMLRFADGGADVMCTACLGIALEKDFLVQGAENHQIVYEGIGLPEGAILDRESGRLRWTPIAEGQYAFYICVETSETCIVKRVCIEVAKSRAEAILTAAQEYDSLEAYTNISETSLEDALKRIQERMYSDSDREFMRDLRNLEEAVRGLSRLSPRLTEDSLTDGSSLDYPSLVYESTMGTEIYNLTDGQGTFCGHYNAVEKAHIMDFGPGFRISVFKFGYQARYGFSDRLAGVQIFGSNDRENWVRLTSGEADFTQAYQETEVREEEKENRYRYLKICKTTEYPEVLRGNMDCLLEFGELRIFGERFEEI